LAPDKLIGEASDAERQRFKWLPQQPERMAKTMVQTKASLMIAMAVAVLFLISACKSSSNQNNRSGGMMNDNRMMSGMMNDNRMMSGMPNWMMGGGMMDENMMRDMGPIHGLLTQHEKIHRTVEEIPGGVRTVTTSEDAQVTELIRTHVKEMKERIEKVSQFAKWILCFARSFVITKRYGWRLKMCRAVLERQKLPTLLKWALLIRQHAKRAVSEFVQGGMNRAMQGTPLPEGYKE